MNDRADSGPRAGRRPPLSILDLAIVSAGHTSADALAATRARRAPRG